MAAKSRPHLTITAEHFLGPLSMPELQGGIPARRRELFAAVAAYLALQDLLETPDPDLIVEPDELALRIPGTAVYVKLSAVGDPQLKEIIALLGGLGLLHEPKTTITLTGLLTLGRLVTLLRAKYGERSIIEALREARPPTPAAVSGVLHGAPCRHLGAGCRYAQDGTCTISMDAVTTTLGDLSRRGVLIELSAVEPHEYRLRL
jgi:hypothetical protein